MDNGRVMRAVGYCRVSMREQLEGHSLEAQKHNIREYAQRQNWHLGKIYTDAAISAKRGSHRPAVEQLLLDAQNGRFDVVVVDKIDRFYRHLSGLLISLEKLRTWNVAFASVQEQLDFTTPWGKLTLTVLGILAEIYIDNLRQETRKGLRQRAREGLWNGNIPFGYCKGLCLHCTDPNGKGYCPDYGGQDKGNGKFLIVHPIEHLGVKKAFELYLTGKYSDRKITNFLNQMKVTLPDGSTVPMRGKGHPGKSQPGSFSRSTVRGILNRVSYTGKVPYYGHDAQGKPRKRGKPQALYPGKHPAIIDEETFRRVQELRKSLAHIPQRKNAPLPRVYPLTGILRCGYCGSAMRGSTGGKQGHYYRDNSRVEHTKKCSQKMIKASTLEAQVAALLRELLKCVDVNKFGDETPLTETQARWQRAQELYLLGEIPRDRYAHEHKRYEKLIGVLSKTDSDARILCEVRAGLENPLWQGTLLTEKKRLLQLAIEAVFVRGNAVVGIQPTVAFLPSPWLGEAGCNRAADGGRTRNIR